MSEHNFQRTPQIEPNPLDATPMSFSEAHATCVEFDQAKNALDRATADAREVVAQNVSEQSDLLNDSPVARQQARTMYDEAQTAVGSGQMRLRLAGFGIGEARRITGPVYTLVGSSAIRATFSVQ